MPAHSRRSLVETPVVGLRHDFPGGTGPADPLSQIAGQMTCGVETPAITAGGDEAPSVGAGEDEIQTREPRFRGTQVTRAVGSLTPELKWPSV